jgi:hypothetical protein
MRGKLMTLLVAGFLGAILAGMWLTQQTRGQAKEKPDATPTNRVGRYQVIQTVPGTLVMTDTVTGQVWQKDVRDRQWADLGSPTKKK